MNVFTRVEPPNWWEPQKCSHRGHPTRARHNPKMPPGPTEPWRPGDR